jgi:Gpi18-like mannosyltransferase
MSCISRSDFDHGWDKLILKSRNNYEMILIKFIAYWIIEDPVNLSDGIWELSMESLLSFHYKWMAKTSSHISFGDVPCQSNEVSQSSTFHHHPREQLMSYLWNRFDKVIHLFSHSLKQTSIVWWSRSTCNGERKSFGTNNQRDFWHFWIHWTVILQKMFYERREKDCQMSDDLYCVRRKHAKTFFVSH